MSIQAIDYEMPAGSSRVTGDGVLDVSCKVSFSAGIATGRGHDLPAYHIEISDQSLSAMPDILKLAALHFPWSERQVGNLTLQGLNPAHFISAQRPVPFFWPAPGR